MKRVPNVPKRPTTALHVLPSPWTYSHPRTRRCWLPHSLHQPLSTLSALGKRIKAGLYGHDCQDQGRIKFIVQLAVFETEAGVWDTLGDKLIHSAAKQTSCRDLRIAQYTYPINIMKVTTSIISLLLLTTSVGAESLSDLESASPARPLNLSLRKPCVATSGSTPIEKGQEAQAIRQEQSADSGNENAVRHLPYGAGYENRRGAASTNNAENAASSGYLEVVEMVAAVVVVGAAEAGDDSYF